MSNRAVVILTEPERCEFADPGLLLTAFLSVQKLNAAGLAASEAFCDHPAGAMEFIEAYSRAFPELQRQSPDLPLPDALYSIVAEGRVMPLPASTASGVTNPDGVSELYPLYVLSLGPPDALVRALQHNSFAKHNVKVLEIAPIERAKSESVPVVDAIVHDGSASSGAETSTDPPHDDDDALPWAEGAGGDPLKLDRIEVDLDHLQVEHRVDQGSDYNYAVDELAPMVVMPPPSATTTDTGAGALSSTDAANIGVSAVVEAPAPTTAVGTAADAPSPPAAAVNTTAFESATPPSLVTGGTGPGGSETSEAVLTTPAAPDTKSPKDAGGEAPKDPASVEVGPGIDNGDDPDDCPEPAAGPGKPDAVPGPDPGVEPAPALDGALELAICAEGLKGASFREPGGDVTYPPCASFVDDDVNYPLPVGSGPLDELFGGSGDTEAVDIEAVLAALPELRGASAVALDDFDLRLLGGDGATLRGADDDGVGPAPDAAAATCPDSFETDTAAGHERLPVSHDLDI